MKKSLESKISVAFITHDPNLKGGGSLSLLTLIDSIADTDIIPKVVLPGRGEFSSALEKRNVDFIVIPNTFWTSSYDGKKQSIRRLFYILRKNIKKLIALMIYLPKYIYYLKKWQTDIIYTNTTVIFEGAITALLLNKPHLWHVRELKDIHFRYDFGNAFFKFFFRKAEAQIFVSNALAEALAEYSVPEKVHVVYNGVAPKKILVQENRKGTYTFSMVGSLQKIKNQVEAIKAIALLKEKYPHARLLIAGTGESKYVESLEALVESYRVSSQVQFIGTVEDPYNKVYALSDAYLMCSTNETFGRVTVEAMFSKLPVIGYKSNITGTKEIVEHKVSGLLYEGGATQLASCMEQFLSNPEWAKSLGQNGYQSAQQRFSLDRYSAHIQSIIREVNLKQAK